MKNKILIFAISVYFNFNNLHKQTKITTSQLVVVVVVPVDVEVVPAVSAVFDFFPKENVKETPRISEIPFTDCQMMMKMIPQTIKQTKLIINLSVAVLLTKARSSLEASFK
jgi:hypothetical protein